MYYTFTCPCGQKLTVFNDHEEYAIKQLYQMAKTHALEYRHTDEFYQSEGDIEYTIRKNVIATESKP